MINEEVYSQLYYIICKLPNDLVKKIPNDIIDYIRIKKNDDYISNIKGIKKIKLLDDTEKYLSVIYTDYLATDEEKRIIKYKERVLSQKKEKEIKKKFNRKYWGIFEYVTWRNNKEILLWWKMVNC